MLYYDCKMIDGADEHEAARELLYSILSEAHGFNTKYTLGHGEDGAPFLLRPDGSREDGLFVSLSHSGGVCAAAVSDSPVGIDVEQVRSLGGRERSIEKRFLQKYQIKQDSQDEELRFFFRWTYAEAAFKCKLADASVLVHKVVEIRGKRSVLCIVGNR